MNIVFRRAVQRDLPGIVALLTDDILGGDREDPTCPPNERYQQAFAAIDRDSNQMLAIVEGNGKLLGCLQLSFIPGLSRQGLWRGQIESVRICSAQRGGGLGRTMIEWAIEQCRLRHCGLVQLTSDKSRTSALRFYESLGFSSSHEGMKLILPTVLPAD